MNTPLLDPSTISINELGSQTKMCIAFNVKFRKLAELLLEAVNNGGKQQADNALSGGSEVCYEL